MSCFALQQKNAKDKARMSKHRSQEEVHIECEEGSLLPEENQQSKPITQETVKRHNNWRSPSKRNSIDGKRPETHSRSAPSVQNSVSYKDFSRGLGE